MKVQIEGNLYLESDDYQFIIKEYTGGTDKHGKPIYKTQGYYTTIQSAIKHLVTMKIKESTATDLKELMDDVRRLYGMIEEKVSVGGETV